MLNEFFRYLILLSSGRSFKRKDFIVILTIKKDKNKPFLEDLLNFFLHAQKNGLIYVGEKGFFMSFNKIVIPFFRFQLNKYRWIYGFIADLLYVQVNIYYDAVPYDKDEYKIIFNFSVSENTVLLVAFIGYLLVTFFGGIYDQRPIQTLNKPVLSLLYYGLGFLASLLVYILFYSIGSMLARYEANYFYRRVRYLLSSTRLANKVVRLEKIV